LPCGKLQRGTDQHPEPPRVVWIIEVVDTVQSLAIEQIRAIDQYRAGSALERRFVESHVAPLSTDAHGKALDEIAGGHAAPPGKPATRLPGVTPRYRGTNSATDQPRRARDAGRAPSTSARPPVFAKGTASDPMMSTLRGGGIAPIVASQRQLPGSSFQSTASCTIRRDRAPAPHVETRVA